MTVTVQRESDDEDEDDENKELNVGKVVCPRYGLEKREAYWLVIGDVNSNALLSIKRISIGTKPTKVRTDINHVLIDSLIYIYFVLILLHTYLFINFFSSSFFDPFIHVSTFILSFSFIFLFPRINLFFKFYFHLFFSVFLD